MSKLNKSVLVMTAMLFAITANAQNKSTVNHGTNDHFTVKSSKNIVVEQKGDNVIMGRTIVPRSTSIKNEAEMYSLTICPMGNWNNISIKSSNGYSNWVRYEDSPEGFQDIVEEGDYEVLVTGKVNDDWFWSTYLLSVIEDITFTPTASVDATNEISAIGIDENGQSLSEKDINLMYYDVIFHWSGNDEYIWFLCANHYSSQITGFKFNDLTELDRISVYAWMAVDDIDSRQKHYFVEYPAIIGNDNINWTVENNKDDMRTHNEHFAITNGNEGYYYMDYFQYIGSENYIDGVGYTFCYGFDENCTFNSDESIKIVTNINAKNPNEYEDGEIKIKLAPAVFQVLPEEDIEDKVIAFSMYYDANGHLIREPFGEFEGYFLTHDTTPNFFESTPVSNLYLGKTSFYYGERTPIAYFQSYNYNESTSPYGYVSCEGMCLFIGENGCQRIGDQDAIIKVVMDGEEVFYDNLYNFNMMGGYFEPEDLCLVQMDIKNEHLVFDGIAKTNRTIISYDLQNDDAMPPTMTILQVIDENNDEQVYLPNYTNAHINFAAGDFEAHIHELYGFIDHMQYFAKPNVEVYYSVENGEWTSLEYTEDETMFHPNYGNFFTIDLSQLDAAVADKWVSLKFIVTDEAGNTQTQELSNVFYAGEMVSVNEHTANSLQHVVYPNPFNGEVRITATQAVNGVANIVVYNVLGEQVYHKAENCMETKEFIIDGSAWKSGVYFYSISTEDGVLQGKIVKE